MSPGCHRGEPAVTVFIRQQPYARRCSGRILSASQPNSRTSHVIQLEDTSRHGGSAISKVRAQQFIQPQALERFRYVAGARPQIGECIRCVARRRSVLRAARSGFTARHFYGLMADRRRADEPETACRLHATTGRFIQENFPPSDLHFAWAIGGLEH